MRNIIFVDIDGVLADFTKGYNTLFNRNIKNDDEFTIKQFCYTEPHFYRMLPVKKEGVELLLELNKKYKVVLLTTPMDGMFYCKKDKVEWVKENIGEYDIIFSDNKAEYVVDNKSILIDDMPHNLDAWNNANGIAIKFPQAIDKILRIIEDTLNPVEEIKKTKYQLKTMDVDTDLKDKQKISGNYKKEHINFKGIPIVIENPKGSIRCNLKGAEHKFFNIMKVHYGYIPKTEGNDGDNIDVFIGDKLNASRVFVVNQLKNGIFDEIKIILACDNIEEAKELYLSNYSKGWEKNILDIIQTNTKKIRDFIKEGNKYEPFKNIN